MGEPRDDGPYNPYQAQTTANTDPSWLDSGQKNIDADIDGMGDYAKNMKIIMENLVGKAADLKHLGTMPLAAWAPGSLPEGEYSRTLMSRNYQELVQYLSFLAQALQNTGSAAQTIATAYAGTDGWSAADMNSVNFAFAERGASRPSGYPQAWLEQVKTWQDAYSENMRTGNAAASGVVVSWDNQPSFTDGAGLHQVAVSTDGVRRELITSVDPATGATTTTTVMTYPPNPNGKTPEERAGYTRTSRQVTTAVRQTSPYSTQVDTTYYGNDGKVTGTRADVTANTGGTNYSSSTAYDKDGNPTNGTSTVTHADGSQTISTTVGGQPDDTLEIGPQTDSVVGMGEQPATDAQNRVRR